MRALDSGRRTAFTLTEILVVAAIVALVVAILLPTIGRLHRQARAAQCVAHLRQIDVALAEWGRRHNGKLPEAHEWQTVVAQSIGGESARQMLSCPEAEALESGGAAALSHYGFNRLAGGLYERRAEAAVVMDYDKGVLDPVGDVAEPGNREDSIFWKHAPKDRHMKRVNVLFADSSVRSVPVPELVRDQMLYEARPGRLMLAWNPTDGGGDDHNGSGGGNGGSGGGGSGGGGGGAGGGGGGGAGGGGGDDSGNSGGDDSGNDGGDDAGGDGDDTGGGDGGGGGDDAGAGDGGGNDNGNNGNHNGQDNGNGGGDDSGGDDGNDNGNSDSGNGNSDNGGGSDAGNDDGTNNGNGSDNQDNGNHNGSDNNDNSNGNTGGSGGKGGKK